MCVANVGAPGRRRTASAGGSNGPARPGGAWRHLPAWGWAALCPALVLAQATEPVPAAPAAAASASPTRADTVLPVVRAGATREARITAQEAGAGVLGELPLLDTPFSIHVLTRELIDKQQAAFIGDLLKNDPSVTVGNVAVPFLLLRGYSVGTDGALYDGLPGHGGLSDGRAGLQSLDRVEVLKGASAFLHGVGAAGSLGGMVNYLPKRPTDQPLRRLGVSLASESLLSVEADLSDRFGGARQFGYRAVLGRRDGTQAVDRYGWQQQTAALALDWRVRPGLAVELIVDHVDNQLPELPPFYILGAGLDVPAPPGADRNVAQSWDDFRTESNNLYLRADWALAPAWSLTAQALINRSGRPGTVQARFGSIDNAAGDVTLFGGQEVSANANRHAQVLLRGQWQTGALKHELGLGATVARQKGWGNYAFTGFHATNLYRPVDSAAPVASDLASPLTSRIQGHSLLISDRVVLNEQWSALLGLRRAHLQVENIGSPAHTTERNLPTAALMFKPTPDALIYLNHAEGLEQGGALSPLDSTRYLPARLTRQLELGAKLDHAGVSYTAALFDMRRPLETYDADAGVNVQRGQQRHRGLELMAQGRVLPQLTLLSGLMWLDARQQGQGSTTDGQRAPGVPRLTAQAWAEYRPLGWPGLAWNVGVYHAGRQFLDAANTQAVPGWTRLDLGASYQTRLGSVPTQWQLTVENAADRAYWASSNGGVLTLADPRTWKLGVRFDL